jgi:hypothetical protein
MRAVLNGCVSEWVGAGVQPETLPAPTSEEQHAAHDVSMGRVPTARQWRTGRRSYEAEMISFAAEQILCAYTGTHTAR